jgi:hypothetical protein
MEAGSRIGSACSALGRCRSAACIDEYGDPRTANAEWQTAAGLNQNGLSFLPTLAPTTESDVCLKVKVQWPQSQVRPKARTYTFRSAACCFPVGLSRSPTGEG